MNQNIPGHDPIRILIVDDDEVDKQIFIEAFRNVSQNHLISSAKDMEQLFGALSQPPLPHLIFLDINMPGTKGVEGLRRLKENPAYSQLPIIMYSVSDRESDIEAAYAGGAHYYMIKPYSVMNLRQSIKKLMTIDWSDPLPTPARHHFVINEAFILPSVRTRFRDLAKE